MAFFDLSTGARRTIETAIGHYSAGAAGTGEA
jgi:hypothetical protein